VILYEYECNDCSKVFDELREIDDRNRPATCVCGGEAKKIISGYRVHGDIEPYYDDNLESYITSKQHRRLVMKAQGLSENFGQGWHTSGKKERKIG